MRDPHDTSPFPIEPIDIALGCFDKVRRHGLSRWSARCPAHDDRHPSLSIGVAHDGTVLLHCFAGCDAQDICAAVGLRLAELFPDQSGYYRPARDGHVQFPRHDQLEGDGEDYVAMAWEAAHGQNWRARFDQQSSRLEGMVNLRRRYGHKF